ncbi:MAG: hypothetical protein NC207_00630 [Bacteroides sp.]|nr:hypothetical protein [Bacteroides sp.]
MKKSIYKTLAVVAVLSMTGCKTPTQISPENAFVRFETTCLGVDGDGSQTLRVWGQGRNRGDAIEQAKRNAVSDVIFKGITAGGGDCDKRPLVNEVNAREKYEDYFNAFFANKGAYNKYVRLDEKRTSRIQAKNSTMEAYGVVLTVDRAALKARLKSDNIL